MSKYWTKEDFEELDKAVTYSDLYNIANTVLKRMPSPIAQVCGPISTGGAGSVKKNLERFDDTIQKLLNKGISVFDQLPFEVPMQKIKQLNNKKEYDMDLLRDFYLPIFESKMVDVVYFLPDWKSSTGARWEHEQVLRLGFKIVYLD